MGAHFCVYKTKAGSDISKKLRSIDYEHLSSLLCEPICLLISITIYGFFNVHDEAQMPPKPRIIARGSGTISNFQI